ncbi:ANKRD17, partial [Symbiodinium necroappetens]
ELQRAKKTFSEVVQQRLKNSSELVSASTTQAYDNNVQKAVEQLRTWANPNSATNDGKHALHRALAQGHTAVARQLLTYKANIWLKENDKTALDVALEVAAEKPGSLELLVDLHEQYQDYKSDAGRGLSCNGLQAGSRTLVKQLPVTETPRLTFLMLAVKHGNADHIKQKPDASMARALAGIRDKGGRAIPLQQGSTALMLAAREGKTASLKELLDGGADKARNLKERAVGAERPCNPVRRTAKTARAGALGHAASSRAVCRNNAGKHTALLGHTALMLAMQGGHEESFKMLLDGGAKRGLKSSAGRGLEVVIPIRRKTVLELSADNAKFLALLGPTALMEAARDGHTLLVKELLEKGAEEVREPEGTGVVGTRKTQGCYSARSHCFFRTSRTRHVGNFDVAKET